MQEIYDVLQRQVLPVLKKGRGILLREPLSAETSRSFIEAYPHARQKHAA